MNAEDRSLEALLPPNWSVVDGSLLECPCGHQIEYDGECPEGHKSPLKRMGMI